MQQRSKFNVSGDKFNRTYDGRTFDSALEMKYYRDVILPGIEAGTIVKCETQKRFTLQPSFIYKGKRRLPIFHIIDFYIVYKDGTEKLVDVKGYKETDAKLKRKMFWYQYPLIDYEWVSYSKTDGGWLPLEEIEKARRKRRFEKRKNKELKEHKGFEDEKLKTRK